MASCTAARDRLCDPLAEVSAHWLISEQGQPEALVAEDHRAWHAGAGQWAGLDDINSHSIGIELANRGDHPFSHRQMQALETLLADILTRWSIPPHRVIAHSDMAPTRKCDPGPRFDWRRLACQGLSIWPDPAVPPCDPSGFFTHARAFGYPDSPEDAILTAFRLRFRPWATGPADATDAGLAANLAQRFPAVFR